MLGVSAPFTLVCISTGGPATTVTWTRDSEPVTEGTETLLVNTSTARYIHRLNTTTGGEYRCSVANPKPSTDSASITVTGIYNGITSELAIGYIIYILGPEAPTGVMVVQDGLTSITVSWSPFSGATGYTISYTGGDSSGSEPVSGGSTNSHTLTGLTNGETYTVSIVAILYEHFFSGATTFKITLSKRDVII